MIGIHYILDVYECDFEKISFVKEIEPILNQIVQILDLSKVNEFYKQFSPIGVTGVILLEESHLSIHTWPESNFAAIDVFSCKEFDTEKLKEIISKYFNTTNVKEQKIIRGNKF